MPVSKVSGFPRTEIEVDGVRRGFLIDTGASFTMVSEVLLKEWGTSHPTWERSSRVSQAKTLGGSTLETMFVPTARRGTHTLTKWGVVTTGRHVREAHELDDVGADRRLAGGQRVEGRSALELDYPNEKLYLSAP